MHKHYKTKCRKTISISELYNHLYQVCSVGITVCWYHQHVKKVSLLKGSIDINGRMVPCT